LETDRSLGSVRVIALEQVIGERGEAPQRIRTVMGRSSPAAASSPGASTWAGSSTCSTRGGRSKPGVLDRTLAFLGASENDRRHGNAIPR